jgi:hypothetical protein
MTPQPAGAKTFGRPPEPARHTIRINVEDGRITYSGSKGEDLTKIFVRRGDTIVWQSDHGNYSVLFKSKTPFPDIAFHGHRGMPSKQGTVVGVNDEYYYAVTVISPEGKPIVDDPVIIVNDGD